MSDIPIIILSHKRWDTIITHKIVKDALVSIPKSQLPLYKEYNPHLNYITHDDNIIGLNAKIQHLYDTFGDMWILDDDILYIYRNYYEKGYTQDQLNLSPEEVYNLLQDIYHICKDANIYLAGISRLHSNATTGLKPISLTEFIVSACMMLRKNEYFYFIPELLDNPDMWINLLNAYYYRISYCDLRFRVKQFGTNQAKGGCAEFRTPEQKKKNYILLRKYFGEAVQLKKKNEMHKKLNKWHPTIKIPF
jgi:hypothetical protein